MRTLIAVILSVAALPALAQMYRWTDESGKTHFTDTPPPASAKKVETRVGRAADSASGNAAEPYALQLARKNSPVKLYTTPGCEACDEARKLLNARGVPFAEVSVTSGSAIAELKTAAGSASVPTLTVGSAMQKGFEEGNYHRALDAAGYPKTGILPARKQTEPQTEPASGAAQPAAEAPPAPRGPYAPRR
jgi:glutaredoxin